MLRVKWVKKWDEILQMHTDFTVKLIERFRTSDFSDKKYQSEVQQYWQVGLFWRNYEFIGIKTQ